jgi:hypothetical protein
MFTWGITNIILGFVFAAVASWPWFVDGDRRELGSMVWCVVTRRRIKEQRRTYVWVFLVISKCGEAPLLSDGGARGYGRASSRSLGEGRPAWCGVASSPHPCYGFMASCGAGIGHIPWWLMFSFTWPAYTDYADVQFYLAVAVDTSCRRQSK